MPLSASTFGSVDGELMYVCTQYIGTVALRNVNTGF